MVSRSCVLARPQYWGELALFLSPSHGVCEPRHAHLIRPVGRPQWRSVSRAIPPLSIFHHARVRPLDGEPDCPFVPYRVHTPGPREAQAERGRDGEASLPRHQRGRTAGRKLGRKGRALPPRAVRAAHDFSRAAQKVRESNRATRRMRARLPTSGSRCSPSSNCCRNRHRFHPHRRCGRSDREPRRRSWVRMLCKTILTVTLRRRPPVASGSVWAG